MTKNEIIVKKFLKNCVIIILISIVVSFIIDFLFGFIQTLLLMIPLGIFMMSYLYISEKEEKTISDL